MFSPSIAPIHTHLFYIFWLHFDEISQHEVRIRPGSKSIFQEPYKFKPFLPLQCQFQFQSFRLGLESVDPPFLWNWTGRKLCLSSQGPLSLSLSVSIKICILMYILLRIQTNQETQGGRIIRIENKNATHRWVQKKKTQIFTWFPTGQVTTAYTRFHCVWNEKRVQLYKFNRLQAIFITWDSSISIITV